MAPTLSAFDKPSPSFTDHPINSDSKSPGNLFPRQGAPPGGLFGSDGPNTTRQSDQQSGSLGSFEPIPPRQHLQFEGPTYLNVFNQPGNYTVTTNFGGNSPWPNPMNRRVQFALPEPILLIRPNVGNTQNGMDRPRMPGQSSPYPRIISRDPLDSGSGSAFFKP